MDEREREEERTDEQTEPEALEDLDVAEQDAEDLKGGTFKQGWPVKWQGSS
jgi:hypothetical protein